MTRKACYIFSSSPSQGAVNIRDNGSRFTVQMNYPLFIPNGSKNATCEVVQANIWNTSPNISPSFNNDMFVAFHGTNMIYIKLIKDYITARSEKLTGEFYTNKPTFGG